MATSDIECSICGGILKVKRDRWFAKCTICGSGFRRWGIASCTYDEIVYGYWQPMGDYESAMIELNEEFPGVRDSV